MAEPGGAFAALRAKFADDLPARLHAVADAIARAATAESGAAQEIVTRVHGLAGSCGLYGFGGVAETLAAVEQALAGAPSSGAERSVALTALAQRIAALAEQPPA